MSQTISITIDGKDGVLPDSFASVMEAVFAIIHSLEKRSWPLNAHRMKWSITGAALVNPLTITSTGEEQVQTQTPAPVFPIQLVEGLEEIEKGIWPKWFTENDIRSAKSIGQQWKLSRRVTIDGRNGVAEKSFTVSKTLFRQSSKLLRQPIVVTREYGSIDGLLIQIGNDPLKDNATAKIRDRFDNTETLCHAAPEIAARLASCMDRTTRVVVYGTITYENGYPKQIQIEDFTSIPTDENLPSLKDIHALGLRIPGGQSPEDYLDELRGDE